MVKRFVVLTLVLLAALAGAGCLWAIGAGRELLAVEMGLLGLVVFLAVWLIALPSALERP
jgi:hypothetical protein